MSRDSRNVSFSKLDLPARNARRARALARIAFVILLLSIGLFALSHLLGPVPLAVAAMAAILSLLVSIAAVAFQTHCLSPRPEGPTLVLIASFCVCAAYGVMFVNLMNLGRMH